MKRALLVGIDYYENFPELSGCVNDADALHPLLARNADDSPNLECRVPKGGDASSPLTRDSLKEMVAELLADGADYALLYFAGHGAQTDDGVALVASDGTNQTPGVSFSEILARINRAPFPRSPSSWIVASPEAPQPSRR